jgi:hypothetical protein
MPINCGKIIIPGKEIRGSGQPAVEALICRSIKAKRYGRYGLIKIKLKIEKIN